VIEVLAFSDSALRNGFNPQRVPREGQGDRQGRGKIPFRSWGVKADSPIKDKKDSRGQECAYSTAGSSTYAAVQAFQKLFGVTYTRS